MSAGDDFLAVMADASARRAQALLAETGGDALLLERAHNQSAPPPLKLQASSFEIMCTITMVVATGLSPVPSISCLWSITAAPCRKSR